VPFDIQRAVFCSGCFTRIYGIISTGIFTSTVSPRFLLEIFFAEGHFLAWSLLSIISAENFWKKGGGISTKTKTTFGFFSLFTLKCALSRVVESFVKSPTSGGGESSKNKKKKTDRSCYNTVWIFICLSCFQLIFRRIKLKVHALFKTHF
jgi:hypothetical protein